MPTKKKARTLIYIHGGEVGLSYHQYFQKIFQKFFESFIGKPERRWPDALPFELIDQLGKEQFNVFISGTQAEGDLVRGQINWAEHVTDLTGKMSLEQYIAFLNRVDAIVAGSTGPLHIASALGTIAIGLYSPARPIHPGRWMPVGEQAHFIENDEAILDGVLSIPASAVKAELDRLLQV